MTHLVPKILNSEVVGPYSGGLQSGGLQSHSLGAPDLELDQYSFDWVRTTGSGHQIWNGFCIHSPSFDGGPTVGGLQSPSTRFGPVQVLI